MSNLGDFFGVQQPLQVRPDPNVPRSMPQADYATELSKYFGMQPQQQPLQVQLDPNAPMSGGQSNYAQDIANFFNGQNSPTEYMSEESKKNYVKDQLVRNKKNEKMLSDRDKKIAEYLRKKDEIGIDAQARMAKLEAANAANPDYSGIASGLDTIYGTNLAPAYAQSGMKPLNDVQMEQLRTGLDKRLNANYGDQAKFLKSMDYQDFAKSQLDQQKKIAADKLDFKRENELAKRNSSIKKYSDGANKSMRLLSNATRALDDMFYAMKEKGQGARTSLSEALFPNEYSSALKRFIEFFGRGQSGAVISDDEWKNFKALISDWKAGKGLNLENMQKMRNILKDSHDQIRTGKFQSIQDKKYNLNDGAPQATPYDKLSNEEVAKRYAEYKRKKNAN